MLASNAQAAEDLLIQYPNNAAEMLIPVNTQITPVIRRINKRLKFISISVPANCTLTVFNNNLPALFFCDESGTLFFNAGINFGDMKIEIVNADTATPARVCYRMIFGD